MDSVPMLFAFKSGNSLGGIDNGHKCCVFWVIVNVIFREVPWRRKSCDLVYVSG